MGEEGRLHQSILQRTLGFALSPPLPIYWLASWKEPSGRTAKDLRDNVQRGMPLPWRSPSFPHLPGRGQLRPRKWGQWADNRVASQHHRLILSFRLGQGTHGQSTEGLGMN